MSGECGREGVAIKLGLKATTAEPNGLVHRPGVLDPSEEAMLLAVLEGLVQALVSRDPPGAHSIPPTRALSYSITFRNLRRR